MRRPLLHNAQMLLGAAVLRVWRYRYRRNLPFEEVMRRLDSSAWDEAPRRTRKETLTYV